tara:strand:- start:285 stop:497 length:213 start_codon:yes stop_codon:yes gene_type:complete
MMINEKQYTVKEAEKLVGLDRSTLYREIESGNLKAEGRPIRISRTNLKSFVLNRTPLAYQLWKEERQQTA